MVAVSSAAYSTNSYYKAAASAQAATATTTASTAASGTGEQAATSVTLSDEALAALAERDFATVVADARAKLSALLTEAGRTSPLEGDKLALDLSSLDARELFAMASDDSFTQDEQDAAGLEMQRRFEAALAGPAAVAEVTGNFTGLYKAAAEYLDSLGAEEKAGADWIAGRAAITEAQKQLQAAPKTMPDAGADDPVALYLALVEAGEAAEPQAIEDVATGARKTLDTLYADAIKAGKVPTFNKSTTVGTYIDMSKFPSRTLSSIVLDATGQFTTQEVSAANTALRDKSGAALLAGFQNAAKSSDPTAFSQNIMSIFASMSAEERQAAGWSEKFYQAAVDSYTTTSKLTQMFAQAGGDSTGFLSWMGK
ncbi:hypothetical protein ASD04_04850 [Devosia sp. Root436]|jgi:hypothetical protein|uniref:hypothetical protein n=1 Tax=Devosia sp. Root436 TaxID=1736537 RepID=UPI0006FE790F|nr:hypothetical protein [Devosia sp. Root436]KQX39981.1 hypothetical protein ASD04_04850 [Devosia sp. Root436]